ncbi:16S rRNA (guanine(966)-N(2))-methyltransferase RsmD [Salinimonas chungwhensis]|uniref:16S rRNA (guanine(966)-N(2))-methyltransferase RsmD n=1 Tax=Salinimonas chungwhensis TaxID=265425 RepID=UPI0003A04E3F|nr:16S rRNA (guanine(966)-N(2))-methyltransferase RsmD [Salinimonas chungwhensis]
MITPSARMKRVRKKSSFSSAKAGHVRIIAGQWRGRKLPVTDVQGLRPTTDRNKETLFNWLMQDIQQTRCLDVFAGSGGLGLEALSRYADYCLFFEKDKNAARQLAANLQALSAKADVMQGDALTLLARQTAPFDIIFVDPPFHQQLVNPALTLIQQHQLVTPGSFIYIEQEPNVPGPDLPDNWEIIRQKQTSGLRYMLVEVV